MVEAPLAGRTVVVTRAAAQAPALTQALVAAGATVIEAPTITVQPTKADIPAGLAAADWVVFTSPNAVMCVTGAVPDIRVVCADHRVAAIGPGTEAALRDAGLAADLVPHRHVAEALVDAFPEGAGTVFLPQSASARPVLAAGIRKKGWHVHAVAAYSTVPVPIEPATLAAARRADAVTFTSSSTVEFFVASAGADGVPPVVVCIGPVTATTAEALGIAVAAVAEPHTIEGLVDAVVTALAR